ncbi:unnamed protein product [Meganyctiphanes norvegica]|uniref:Uncharacterized protein n=1 Tax=Meganyctiphanes norvegica TaxID=48144 RepID=A0AAV2PIN2_MEGNR
MGGLALRAAFDITMVDASKSFLSGREVSLSLLLGCIKASCVNIAPLGDDKWFTEDIMQLEYLLTSMQQYLYCLTKLTTLNQEEMIQDINDLQSLFANGLKAAKIRFNVDDAIINDVADSMYNNINNIRNQVLEDPELFNYQQSLLNDKMTFSAIEMYSPKLHEKFKDAKKRLNIFSAAGYDIPHDITTLFTNFVIKSVGEHNIETAVDIKDLIHLTCKSFIVQFSSLVKPTIHSPTNSLSKNPETKNSYRNIFHHSYSIEDPSLAHSDFSNKHGKVLRHCLSTGDNLIGQSVRSDYLRNSSYSESQFPSFRNSSCTKCRLTKGLEFVSNNEEISTLTNKNQDISNVNLNRYSIPLISEFNQDSAYLSKENLSVRNSKDMSPKGSLPSSPRNSQMINSHILSPNEKQSFSISPCLRRKNNRKISLTDRNSSSRPNSGFLCQCSLPDLVQNQSYEEIMHIPQNKFGLRQLLLISGSIPDITSLVSVIMHSWAEHNDTVDGLNEFDFLFLMEFWNSEIKTFEELIRSHIPNLSRKLKDDSLKFIIGTKMLIITDIYDGINPVSNILFEEIISFSKLVDLTIICTVGTTRVDDFYKAFNSGLTSINIVHIEIAELKSDDRNRFLTSIFTHLKVTNKEEINYLIQYLNKCSKPMKHFLSSNNNLAILAVMWSSKSEKLKCLQTPTEFLHLVHSTTFKLLIKQLQTNESSRHRSIFDLDPALKDFVKSVGYVALLTKSLNQVFMNDMGKSIIEVAACKYKFSFEQIVSAYFTKKLFWTRRDQKWCFSSFNWQEFLAAIFISLELPIIETTSTENQKRYTLISSMKRRLTSTKSQIDVEFGMIEKVLRDLHVNDTSEFDISRYKKVLCHFMGILALQSGDIVSSIAEELVDLLQRTGVETKDEWLDLLTEYSAHKTVIKFIISNFPPNEDLVLTDDRVFPYSSLLRYIKPSSLNIIISGDPRDIQSFPSLVHELSQLNCDVQLQLYFPWKNPDVGVAYKFLPATSRRCTVTEFKGLVYDIETLPIELKKLKISISNEKNEFTLTSTLTALKQYVPDLWELGVHLKAGSVEPSSLMPLPYIIFTNIYLSGVNDTHAEWTCDAIKSLLPLDGKYWRINFPNSKLTKAGLEVILEGLSSRIVQLEPAGSIHICSPNLPQMLQHTINCLAREHLKTWCWRYDTDEEIFGW